MSSRVFTRWGPVALLCLLAVCGLGCQSVSYNAPIIPPPGVLYSEFNAPLILPDKGVDISGLDMVEIHTSHFQIPYAYLRIINLAWGEAALEEAARQGGFDDIVYADYKFTTILSVFSTFTVRAYGS